MSLAKAMSIPAVLVGLCALAPSGLAADASIRIQNNTSQAAFFERSSCGPDCTSTVGWPTITKGFKGQATGTNSQSSISHSATYSFGKLGTCTFSFSVGQNNSPCAALASCSGSLSAKETVQRYCYPFGDGDVTFTVTGP